VTGWSGHRIAGWRGRAVLTLLALLAAVIVAGCGGTKTVTETVTVTATSASPARLGPPRNWVEFGHIDSLRREGGRYMMRFDPAWFLSGVTANQAAAEDGAVEPGEPVPNDNYRVDESHRLYTYVVPANAKVTVVTNRGNPARLGATPIGVAELAKIVNGTSTMKLFEPLDSGVWLTIHGDRVLAIDHQYQP
jgi:hypothetical protein